MSRDMKISEKEYWMRRYDTEEREHDLCRLNTERPIYAQNLKEAQSEAERLNGCASTHCIWTKHDTPTRHWGYSHRNSPTQMMEVELYPSEAAMKKVPVNGENWTRQNIIDQQAKSPEPETELQRTERVITHLEKLIPALEAEGKTDLAEISKADLSRLKQRLVKLQPEPETKQLNLF